MQALKAYIKKTKKVYKINQRETILLLGVFILALLVRFAYFYKDIYFAYDQARDAFVSLKIMSGDLKVVGPPATFKGVYHGALFYYPFGLIYYLSQGSPIPLAALLRIYNALGVFIIFFITYILFKNKKVGFIASILYAFSFEQTQYSLFLGHPALAVIWVLVFYLGLALLFFKKEKKGLIMALLGMGLSVQFHFSMISLFLILIVLLIVFRKALPRLDIKTLLLSLLAFLAGTLTYILAEIKFDFRTTKALVKFFFNKGGGASSFYPQNILVMGERFIRDNIFATNNLQLIIFLFLLLVLGLLILKKKSRSVSLFLLFWLFGGLLPYTLGASSATVYYYSIGGSVSLIILTSYLITRLQRVSKLFGVIILGFIILSNLKLIQTYNPSGTIPEINVQDKVLLLDEMRILDYMYKKSKGEDFSVNALTIPFNINTTWSYVFETYGKNKYGYLPIWGGNAAGGFEGNLQIITAQSELPGKRFTILEPSRGMPASLKEKFLKEEGYFWAVKEEKKFGEFIVQERERI